MNEVRRIKPHRLQQLIRGRVALKKVVKPENLYELPMDAIHLLRQNLAATQSGSGTY